VGIFDRLFNKTPEYDFSSIEVIQSIQIPKYAPLKGALSTPVNNIEYILQRKATEFAKKGNWDFAIACLKKSNEIMPHSNFYWSKKDYFRLVEYLKRCNAFQEARGEQERIEAMFEMSLTTQVLRKVVEDAKLLHTDLVMSADITYNCVECASYCKRIFSLTGKDIRFPRLPTYFYLSLPEHDYCIIDFYLFFDEIDKPTWSYRGDLVSWSNRPLSDERTNAQNKLFIERVSENEQMIVDRNNYDLLSELLPEVAPKSFGSYRRMKNLNSPNYQKLSEVASTKQINLNAKPNMSIYKFS
jgi:hypothetical protein